MWDENKQARFDELRRDESSRTLSLLEQQELTALFVELNQAEELQLAPAFERAMQEQAQLRKTLEDYYLA